jgi:hypothetical protein
LPITLSPLFPSPTPPERRVKKRSHALFPHLLSPQRSKRPLLVFLSARRKAFEKPASRTERSSIWTLTREFRSRSASSRRRTGATPPKQPPRLTSRERSTYPQDSSASDGRNNTPLSQPIFLLAATDSARRKSTSLAKRIITTVRAAEKTSTSVKIAGQFCVLFCRLSIASILSSGCKALSPIVKELHWTSQRRAIELRVSLIRVCVAFLFSFVDTVTHTDYCSLQPSDFSSL